MQWNQSPPSDPTRLIQRLSSPEAAHHLTPIHRTRGPAFRHPPLLIFARSMVQICLFIVDHSVAPGPPPHLSTWLSVCHVTPRACSVPVNHSVAYIPPKFVFFYVFHAFVTPQTIKHLPENFFTIPLRFLPPCHRLHIHFAHLHHPPPSSIDFFTVFVFFAGIFRRNGRHDTLLRY